MGQAEKTDHGERTMGRVLFSERERERESPKNRKEKRQEVGGGRPLGLLYTAKVLRR